MNDDIKLTPLKIINVISYYTIHRKFSVIKKILTSIALRIQRHFKNVAKGRVEGRCIRHDLNGPPAKCAPVCADVEKFRLCLPLWLLVSPSATFLDNKAVFEMRHKFEVFLLLLHPNHFKFFSKECLKLLL